LEDFADDTIEFWQPRMRRDLSREDARQIAENVSGFFRVLLDWDAVHREQQQVREQHRQVGDIQTRPTPDSTDELTVSPPSSKLTDEFRTAARDDEQ